MFKIAIIGPESTGKTALAKQLAEYYNAPWVPEYAREYVENLRSPYTYEDVCNIAIKQIEFEKFYETNSVDAEYVFFDTDLIITKVWFSYCFDKIPEFLLNQLHSGFFDAYLLCAPDLPWEPDSVREHGKDREYFFNWYKREIEGTKKAYVIITGVEDQRMKNAIAALQSLKF